MTPLSRTSGDVGLTSIQTSSQIRAFQTISRIAMNGSKNKCRKYWILYKVKLFDIQGILYINDPENRYFDTKAYMCLRFKIGIY